MTPTKVAIIGSGNIGTDLMIKILRTCPTLQVAAMVGIDPDSDGLARARRLGVPATHDGVGGLIAMVDFDAIDIVLDATSAAAHLKNAAALAPYRKTLIDLTPAAIGPPTVPAVNLADRLADGATNFNMVTCGGQATIPVVAAIASVTPVPYAEIVASISSKSAGPGTRANIDEFTETTSRAIESVGGAVRGKAIIILNPAEPAVIMRDTVSCLVDGSADHRVITESVHAMIARVAKYVPGYRLKQPIQFIPVDDARQVRTLVPAGSPAVGTQVTVFLEVEGAAHYLPSYAGNLDIMTSAAIRVAEAVALNRTQPTESDSAP
ncbi:acetaldehyde dehydrogenase (acetylating) [Mycolicibacterium mucogenicum]|uniref:Acetaldehyde dehydrogenase n=1 Tax=Mycolicibacterium mucogenicum TaxID=56689 RepID=A0A1A3GQA6_MYCMU|nr:acetaldehyde dehydrogenase (acetylating) [Mycolicibacterium mucogenicum]OBJ37524.1 acetaldehyde dehydrogenase (acetylating) [Mycolicibacterium mucogenicum]